VQVVAQGSQEQLQLFVAVAQAVVRVLWPV
jgi:hypothetical protein